MEILGVGPAEMLLILVIALIVFGPGKLPEIGAAIGRAVNDFRRASRALTADLQGSVEELRTDLTQPLSDIQAGLTDVAKSAQAEAAAVQREAKALSAEINAPPKPQAAPKAETKARATSPLEEAEENWLRLGSAVDDEGTSAG